MSTPVTKLSDNEDAFDSFFGDIGQQTEISFATTSDTPATNRRTGSDTLTDVGQVSERLSLAEAAVHFAVSERTIQRRITKGQLRSEKDDQGRVFVFCPTVSDAVFVNDDKSTTDEDGDRSCTESGKEQQTGSDNVGQFDVTLVRHLMDKLEAATYRNGFLEAQLEARDRELKLLTDSQHKDGMLRRFWDWFTGGGGIT